MHRYESLVRLVQDWIEAGVLKGGDRLPSIRQMSAQSGFSPMTVQHSYGILESEGLVRSSPRSGYYVSALGERMTAFSRLEMIAEKPTRPVAVSASLQTLFDAWERHRISGFCSLQMSPDLHPAKELGAFLTRAVREEARNPLRPASGENAHYVRDFVRRRALLLGGRCSASDVVLTISGQIALDLGLSVTTEPGDVVIVEAPTSFQVSSTIRRRGLKALEVYSHPVSGVDPGQFEYLVSKNRIAACVLSGTHHSPTGVSYGDEALRRIVEVARQRKIPILEDCALADFHFGPKRPNTLKSFDEDDIVMQYGDMSSVLGQRYGIGWIIGKRFGERLNEQRYLTPQPLGDTVAAVAGYMQNHSFERHLRRARATLEGRVRRGLNLISHRFPKACSLSRPNGGYLCWMRITPMSDSIGLAEKAVAQRTGVLPGPLFSVTGSFRNFIAVNLSYPLDRDREGELAWLGGQVGGAEAGAIGRDARDPVGLC